MLSSGSQASSTAAPSAQLVAAPVLNLSDERLIALFLDSAAKANAEAKAAEAKAAEAKSEASTNIEINYDKASKCIEQCIRIFQKAKADDQTITYLVYARNEFNRLKESAKNAAISNVRRSRFVRPRESDLINKTDIGQRAARITDQFNDMASDLMYQFMLGKKKITDFLLKRSEICDALCAVESARNHIENKQFSDALDILNVQLEILKNYRCVEVYFFRGQSYYGLGRVEEAIADFKEAVKIITGKDHPHNAIVYCYLGMMLTNLDTYEDAVSFFEKASKQINDELILSEYMRESIDKALSCIEKKEEKYGERIKEIKSCIDKIPLTKSQGKYLDFGNQNYSDYKLEESSDLDSSNYYLPPQIETNDELETKLWVEAVKLAPEIESTLSIRRSDSAEIKEYLHDCAKKYEGLIEKYKHNYFILYFVGAAYLAVGNAVACERDNKKVGNENIKRKDKKINKKETEKFWNLALAKFEESARLHPAALFYYHIAHMHALLNRKADLIRKNYVIAIKLDKRKNSYGSVYDTLLGHAYDWMSRDLSDFDHIHGDFFERSMEYYKRAVKKENELKAMLRAQAVEEAETHKVTEEAIHDYTLAIWFMENTNITSHIYYSLIVTSYINEIILQIKIGKTQEDLNLINSDYIAALRYFVKSEKILCTNIGGISLNMAMEFISDKERACFIEEGIRRLEYYAKNFNSVDGSSSFNKVRFLIIKSKIILEILYGKTQKDLDLIRINYNKALEHFATLEDLLEDEKGSVDCYGARLAVAEALIDKKEEQFIEEGLKLIAQYEIRCDVAEDGLSAIKIGRMLHSKNRHAESIKLLERAREAYSAEKTPQYLKELFVFGLDRILQTVPQLRVLMDNKIQPVADSPVVLPQDNKGLLEKEKESKRNKNPFSNNKPPRRKRFPSAALEAVSIKKSMEEINQDISKDSLELILRKNKEDQRNKKERKNALRNEKQKARKARLKNLRNRKLIGIDNFNESSSDDSDEIVGCIEEKSVMHPCISDLAKEKQIVVQDSKEEERLVKKISPSDFESSLLKIFKKDGKNSYFYGGLVRDGILAVLAQNSHARKDIDIVTDMTEKEVEKNVRATYKGVEIKKRIRSGRTILSFKLNNAGESVGVDVRLVVPEKDVKFTPQSDAKKLHFTIAANYADEYGNTFCGVPTSQIDLLKKELVCIGDTRVCFENDPLRIILAVKDSVRQKKTISPSMAEIIKECIKDKEKGILSLLPEDVNGAMSHLFGGQHALASLRYLKELNILSALFPEIAEARDDQQCWLEKMMESNHFSVNEVYVLFFLMVKNKLTYKDILEYNDLTQYHEYCKINKYFSANFKQEHHFITALNKVKNVLYTQEMTQNFQQQTSSRYSFFSSSEYYSNGDIQPEYVFPQRCTY